MARVSAVKYGETIWSDLFAGNRLTVQCLQPAVLAAESSLRAAVSSSELDERQRKRVVWRMDGGAGSDEQLRWLLSRQYQIVAKGFSNRRAEVLAKQVTRWDAYGDVWLGQVAPPVDFGRPVQVLVKKRLKNDTFCHSYYVITLRLPSKGHFMTLYDNRGGAEVEQFRNDKNGLHLSARRKRSFLGQIALILLTDLAHNLLTDFHHKALVGTKFEPFGQKRIVRDLLQIPGKLTYVNGQLKQIELLSSHANSKNLLICLEKYCLGD